jgi:hypothetical protein
MEAYCEKQAIAPESIRFLCMFRSLLLFSLFLLLDDGQRIVAEQTPASV